jgi:hypothetical protein
VAVCLLCSSVPLAVLRDQRIPLLAACQADRREGERQEEEVKKGSEYCQGDRSTAENRLDRRRILHVKAVTSRVCVDFSDFSID